MADRVASISRKTAETDIQIKLNLDGTGAANVDTGDGQQGMGTYGQL